MRPIVLINKIDRSDARPDEVLDEILTFCFTKCQRYAIRFSCALCRWTRWLVRCRFEKDERKRFIAAFDLILKHVEPPKFDENAPFSMLATLLDHSPYFGRMLTGRIYSGKAKFNELQSN